MNRTVRYFQGLSLRRRLLVVPLLGLMLIGLLTAAFIYESGEENDFLVSVVERDFAAFNRYTEVFINLSAHHIGLYDLLTSAAKADEETVYDNAKNSLYAIHAAIRQLDEFLPPESMIDRSGDGSAAALRREVLALTQAYRRSVTSAVEMTTVNIALAPSQVVLANERFLAMNRAFARLLDLQRQAVVMEMARRIDYGQRQTAIFGALGVSLAALLLIASITLSRILSRALETQISVLAEMGGGAGTGTKASGADEIARIGEAIAAFRRTQLELQGSEARFRAAFEQAGVGMALRDIDPHNSRWLRVNQKLCDILGYTREELLQLTSVDITPPEDRDLAIDYNEKLLKGEITSYSREKRYQRKDGRIIWADIALAAVHGPDGHPTHVISVIQDVSDRKIHEERIAALSRIHAVLSGINSTIVRVSDRQELFNEACRIAVEQGGFPVAWVGILDPGMLNEVPVAWAGENAESLVTLAVSSAGRRAENPGVVGQALKEARPAFSNDLAAAPIEGAPRRSEALRRGYRSLVALPLLVNGAVTGHLSMFARAPGFFTAEEMKLLTELAGDISFALGVIGKEEKINYLAYYDALTGLPNRLLFDDRMRQRLQAARHEPASVALVLINLERFRIINDTMGRSAGDALLKLLAERLLTAVFDRDSVARIHADVFAALLSGIEDEAHVARIVEEKILGCLSQPFPVAGQELRISAKAGVALFPHDATQPDALFSNAEAALRQARTSNDRYLFYAREMNEQVAERLKLETKMRHALEKEQFVLHYQRKVELASRRLSGLEALIRWNDPETGLVPPGSFIPLLEETGMIIDAGRWVMRRALEDYHEWYVQGLQPPRIAVNVSPVQLRQKNFVDVVREAIRESAASSGGLELEITESLIMEDIEGNIGKLRAIRDMGVNIAIDDFGTGYSSLGYLAKLPVNALKIDRSFIVTMTTDPDSMSIVSTVISLAHSLNLKVIAEGVESEEQHKILRLLKCDEIQGYLFGRPLPAADTATILQTGRTP